MEPTTPSLPDDDVAAIDRLRALYQEHFEDRAVTRSFPRN